MFKKLRSIFKKSKSNENETACEDIVVKSKLKIKSRKGGCGDCGECECCGCYCGCGNPCDDECDDRRCLGCC